MMNEDLGRPVHMATGATPSSTPAWLKKTGHILLRWGEEPVGVAVPLFALFVVFFAPQMPDMFAGMAVGFPLGLGFSAALLGFSAWYWTRAALLAPYKIDDAKRRAARGRDEITSIVEWSREWAPRVVLLVAAIIAVAPLLMAGSQLLDNSLLISVLVGLIFIIAAFFFVIWRQRLTFTNWTPPPAPR
jgi:hypothetical protein